MELQPGQRLGGYEIVSHVKSGGMASLYLARRRGAAGFSRPVAIKVVHPELARDPKFIRMFLDEARLAVMIQHPNVVQVEELIEAEGTYLMAMEYVHGTSLFEVLRRVAKQGRRLSPELAVWIAVQVADGLHAAHELRGPDGDLLDVVHRDISPQNILLSFSGHVKVIDFGIAKSRQRMDLTRTGVIRGKLGYMSPEQASANQVDRRTDVYALGIVLWEMLTSRRLFKGKTEVELLDKVRQPRIARPSLYGEVPSSLENAVMDALTPPVDMRTKSAHDLRVALLRAVPDAAAIHSSMLAGLLGTVMADSIQEGPVSWSEAGLTGEPVRPSTSFLQAHTMHASAPDFTASSDLLDDDDDEPEPPTFAFAPELGGATIPGHRPSAVPPPVPPPGSLTRRPVPPAPRASAVAAVQHQQPPEFEEAGPSRQLVARPQRPPAMQSSGQFTLPPGAAGAAPRGDVGLATASYDPEDPRIQRARLPENPPKPNRIGNFFVTLLSLSVLVGALGIAGALVFRAGVLDEFLGEGTDQPATGAAVDADVAVVDAGVPVDEPAP
ncbi:MAG: serine/threonine-protein kinase [Myxococcota bacterium]